MGQEKTLSPKSLSFFKIKSFISDFKKTDSLNSIITFFTSYILSLRHVKSASLFLLDENTFEFYNSLTLPGSEASLNELLFNRLIDDGTIGSSIVEEKVMKGNVQESVFYLVLPLKSLNKISGFYLLTLNVEPDLEDEFSTILSMISPLAALSISNFNLNMKIEKMQELVEQKVASRTINLLETKKNMSDKLEDLKSNISMSLPHEVRTPINIIMGFSEFLKKNFDTIDSLDAIDMLTNIINSTKRLNRLFENYLYYSNLYVISTNLEEISKLRQEATYSAELLIDSVVRSKAENEDRLKDIRLDLCHGDIFVPEEYLSKVISELADNALKYSIEGTPIEVISSIHESDYIIRFRDYGRGLTDDQINSVQAFLQFDRKVHEQQGFGLGLAIVMKILNIINGKINIKSVPDEGTEILIEIPLYTET
jgi:K+-sensing histidine kinase KdpD